MGACWEEVGGVGWCMELVWRCRNRAFRDSKVAEQQWQEATGGRSVELTCIGSAWGQRELGCAGSKWGHLGEVGLWGWGGGGVLGDVAVAGFCEGLDRMAERIPFNAHEEEAGKAGKGVLRPGKSSTLEVWAEVAAEARTMVGRGAGTGARWMMERRVGSGGGAATEEAAASGLRSCHHRAAGWSREGRWSRSW